MAFSKRQQAVINSVRRGAGIKRAMLESGYGPGCIDGLAPQLARILGLAERSSVDDLDSDLPFSHRVAQSLRAAGIESLDDLEGLSDNDLIALDNFGNAALKEVRALVPAPESGDDPSGADESKE